MYDDAHTRNLADAIAVLGDPAAPVHTRVQCGWCEGTGTVSAWDGWNHVGERACARCAGRGFLLVEKGSCHD